jgi:hypothetical protein
MVDLLLNPVEPCTAPPRPSVQPGRPCLFWSFLQSIRPWMERGPTCGQRMVYPKNAVVYHVPRKSRNWGCTFRQTHFQPQCQDSVQHETKGVPPDIARTLGRASASSLCDLKQGLGFGGFRYTATGFQQERLPVSAVGSRLNFPFGQ